MFPPSRPIIQMSKVVSFASIAPYDDDSVQSYYLALWRKYGHLIDYVNFQFYAYEKGTTIPQFIEHFETQNTNYIGGKVLVSFGTDGSGGLSPDNGFFEACSKLQREIDGKKTPWCVRPDLRWAPWRSASARERPRGAVLCKRDQGNGKRARDTRGEGRRARHGVAEGGSSWLGLAGQRRKRAETVRKRESRDSERHEMSEKHHACFGK
uniref:GH18 domain-containing protein n=1 Tax=Fagus sylvatica TaxID=28930 RepID=A0A2N9GZK5_FAGSY